MVQMIKAKSYEVYTNTHSQPMGQFIVKHLLDGTRLLTTVEIESRNAAYGWSGYIVKIDSNKKSTDFNIKNNTHRHKFA